MHVKKLDKSLIDTQTKVPFLKILTHAKRTESRVAFAPVAVLFIITLLHFLTIHTYDTKETRNILVDKRACTTKLDARAGSR